MPKDGGRELGGIVHHEVALARHVHRYSLQHDSGSLASNLRRKERRKEGKKEGRKERKEGKKERKERKEKKENGK